MSAFYAENSTAQGDDRFVLYRIIGNDLPPRHRRGQALDNLRFILEHEPDFIGCEKRFIVNRIADAEQESAVLDLLRASGHSFEHLPLRLSDYQLAQWDIEGVPSAFAPYTRRYACLSDAERGRVLMRLYRHKNNAAINNNGARNLALQQGRSVATWIMPWDGNCFLSEATWRELKAAIIAQRELPYFIVPMARVTRNQDLLQPGFRPQAREEPQLIFRRDAALGFDDRYFYGRRPKVELLWRLGVPGPWEAWGIEPWDLPAPDFSADVGRYATVGWVARLASGQPTLESNAQERFVSRVSAVIHFLDELDRRAQAQSPTQPNPQHGAAEQTESPLSLPDSLRTQLLETATDALKRATTEVDRIASSPFLWAFKAKPLFEDTRLLVLAWQATGDVRFAEAAAEIIAGSLDANNLTHAGPSKTVRWWSRKLVADNHGLHWLLDAALALEQTHRLDPSTGKKFRQWLKTYLGWLSRSRRGRAARASSGSLGTSYDLQVASIAIFLGDRELARGTFIDSRFRLLAQFAPSGEPKTLLPARYRLETCCFNLQCWADLATWASRHGEDLWGFRGSEGGGLGQTIAWLIDATNSSHLGLLDRSFDPERLAPLLDAYRRYDPSHAADLARRTPTADTSTPIFPAATGIPPFWQVAPIVKPSPF